MEVDFANLSLDGKRARVNQILTEDAEKRTKTLEFIFKIVDIAQSLQDDNDRLRNIIFKLSISNPVFLDIKEEINLEVKKSGLIYHPPTGLTFDNLMLKGFDNFTLVCIGVYVEDQVQSGAKKLQETDLDSLAALNEKLANLGLEILSIFAVKDLLSEYDKKLFSEMI